MSLAQFASSALPIQVSSAAIAEIRRIKSSQGGSESQHVRFSLLSGGCEDFLYNLRLDSEVHETDLCYSHQDIEFVVDAAIFPKIQGLQLDYSEDLMGGSFRFHNPNAAKQCGCGNSFSLSAP
jgi:iron-sulfur cluster assembly protein